MTTFSLSVHAGEKGVENPRRITFGLEWGYVATFQSGYFHNFFAPEGYRDQHMGNKFGLISNADMYAHIGYDLSPKWNLSLYVGYEGIADIHKAIPVSLRITRSFGQNRHSDRWLAFADAGSGVCLKQEPQEIFTVKLGGGYRLALSRKTSIDFILAARATYTHPQIIYDKVPIPLDRTNRNIAYVSAVSLGMALNF